MKINTDEINYKNKPESAGFHEGRDANGDEATWHTQAEKFLRFPPTPSSIGRDLIRAFPSCRLWKVGEVRSGQVADVKGVWWELVDSVYARHTPVHPATYQAFPGPGSRWSRDLCSLPFLSIVSQDLGNPEIQKNPVVGAHRQVCAPRGGRTRKRGHFAGQTKRSKPSFHLLANPPERLHRSSSSFLPSRWAPDCWSLLCPFGFIFCTMVLFLALIDCWIAAWLIWGNRDWGNRGPC